MSKSIVKAFKETMMLVLSVARTANNMSIAADILRAFSATYNDMYNNMLDLANEERFLNGETAYYVALDRCANEYAQKEMWLDLFVVNLDYHDSISYPIDLNALARQIALANGDVKPPCKYKLTHIPSKVRHETYDMIKDVTRYALRVIKASDSIEHMMHRFERMEHIYWDVSCEHYDDWYTHGNYDAYEDYELCRAKANTLDAIAREVRVSHAYPELFHIQYPFDVELFSTPISLIA